MKWQNALGLFKRFNVENKMKMFGGGRGVSMWVYLFVVKTSAQILHIKTLDIVPASSRWLFLFEYRTLCSFIFIACGGGALWLRPSSTPTGAQPRARCRNSSGLHHQKLSLVFVFMPQTNTDTTGFGLLLPLRLW